MLDAVSTALGSLITMIGTILTALTSSTGALAALLPLLAIGVAISLVLLTVKVIRRVAWGA